MRKVILIIIIKVRKKKKKKRRRKRMERTWQNFNTKRVFENTHKWTGTSFSLSLSRYFFDLGASMHQKTLFFFFQKSSYKTPWRDSLKQTLISSLLKVTAQHAIEEEEKEHVLSLVLLKSYRSSYYLIFLKRRVYLQLPLLLLLLLIHTLQIFKLV